MTNPSPSSQSGNAAARPLWIIAGSMVTIALCLVLLVVKKQLGRSNESESASGAAVQPDAVDSPPLSALPEPSLEPTKPTPVLIRPRVVTNRVAETRIPQIIVAGVGAERVPIYVDRPILMRGVVDGTGRTNQFGTIIGRVILRGTAPPEIPLPQAAQDSACGRFYATPPSTHHFVVGEGGALADTLVYVDEYMPKHGYNSALGPPVIALTNCEYLPQISAMTWGQELVIRNDSSIPHSFHSFPTNKANLESLATLRSGATKSIRFTRPEFFLKLACDNHPWEFAWVSIMPHPFFDVTDTDGMFVIRNVPEGRYKVRAVHRKALASDSSVQNVFVKQGEIASATFVLDAPRSGFTE